MIIVSLMGGLGNQMFQYALGRSLAIINKLQLVAAYLNHNKSKIVVAPQKWYPNNENVNEFIPKNWTKL